VTEQEVKWIPVRAAAKMLKCSRQRVGYLCRTGVLRSELIESTRLVSLRSVMERVELLAKGGCDRGTRR
jgi:hypothetical protein